MIVQAPIFYFRHEYDSLFLPHPRPRRPLDRCLLVVYCRAEWGLGIEDKHMGKLKADLEAFTCPAGLTTTTWFELVGPASHGFKSIDFKSVHSAIGRANLNIEYNLSGRVLCKCEQDPASGKIVIYKHLLVVNANFRYDFYDQFRDAADWANWRAGDNEYIGGTRFNITGAWEVKRREINIWKTGI